MDVMRPNMRKKAMTPKVPALSKGSIAGITKNIINNPTNSPMIEVHPQPSSLSLTE